MVWEFHSILTLDVALPTGETEVHVEQRIYQNDRDALTGIEYAIYAPASIITWAEEDEDTAGQIGRAIVQAVLPALFGEVIPPSLTYFVMVDGHCIFTSEDESPLTLDEPEFTPAALHILAKVLSYATVDRAEELFNDRAEMQALIDIARRVYAHFPGDQDPAEGKAAIAEMDEALNAMFPPDGEGTDESHCGSQAVIYTLD